MKRLICFWLMLFSFLWGGQAVFTYEPAAQSTPQLKPNPVSRVLNVHHGIAEIAGELGQKLFPKLKIFVAPSRQQIHLFGLPETIQRFRLLTESLDKPLQVIEFSVYLLEVNRHQLHQLGLDWQGLKSKAATHFIQQADFASWLQLVEKQGQARILANPIVRVLEDEIAEIKIGDRVPYTVPHGEGSSWELRYLDAGIQVQVQGRCVSSKNVQTRLSAQVQHIKQWKPTVSGDYPVLSNREIKLNCPVPEGQVLILGGLIQNQSRVNWSRIPILSDLPFIGGLFVFETSEQEESEIIFAISPDVSG